MEKQLYLKYTYGNHNYKEWILYWGTHGGDERDIMLFRTQDEELAKAKYEQYKITPPKSHKIDEIIF